MKRLILSIIAGLLTSIILASATDHILHVTGVYPPYGEPFTNNGLLLLAFVYWAVIAVFGAYLTAVIAKSRAGKAVLVLGIIGSVLWLAGAIVMWDAAAAWYNIAGILTGVPLALAGGRLYERRAAQFDHTAA